jgi:hypothetical protein
MKHLLILGGGIVVMALVLQFLLHSVTTTMKGEQERYKHFIGKTVILENDTLQVVDYSTLQETFTLSNGRVVAFSFVEKSK